MFRYVLAFFQTRMTPFPASYRLFPRDRRCVPAFYEVFENVTQSQETHCDFFPICVISSWFPFWLAAKVGFFSRWPGVTFRGWNSLDFYLLQFFSARKHSGLWIHSYSARAPLITFMEIQTSHSWHYSPFVSHSWVTMSVFKWHLPESARF